MFKRTNPIVGKNKNKFDSYLGHNRSWWHYYQSFKNVIDDIVDRIEKDEILIDTVSLTLLFLIRHCLELGLKANILDLEKANQEIPKLRLKGNKGHDLSNLYEKFIRHIELIKEKNELNKAILKQIEDYKKKFEVIKTILDKLDKGSYSFRYPIDTKGNYNFTWDTRENISDVVNVFYEIQPFLLFTRAVFEEEGIIFKDYE